MGLELAARAALGGAQRRDRAIELAHAQSPEAAWRESTHRTPDSAVVGLGPLVADKVAEVLPVPRGKADHLAMHGGTMVLIEAMIIGLAGSASQTAFDSLDRLSVLRGSIDKAWVKRGTKKTRSK